jgi:hypothetical protein
VSSFASDPAAGQQAEGVAVGVKKSSHVCALIAAAHAVDPAAVAPVPASRSSKVHASCSRAWHVARSCHVARICVGEHASSRWQRVLAS